MITVVSGLPRSGTSLMMQMLEAGGMETVTDGQRAPDADNPKGYYELERVKRLKEDHAWLAEAEGKALKVVSMLLYDLPADFRYRVLFMERDLDEILSSQRTMLARRGTGEGESRSREEAGRCRPRRCGARAEGKGQEGAGRREGREAQSQEVGQGERRGEAQGR